MALLTKLKSWLAGAPKGRTEKDGIIHKGDTTDGFVKSFAEKSAVAGALQKMGYRQTDPAKHKERVQLFTDVAHWLHTNHPDFQPVAHYRKHAEQLNVPDVVQPTPEPTALGEWPEPPKHTHYTVPNVGPAGRDLTDAAVPMVRAIDRILEHVRPGHVALDNAKDDPPPTLADEAKPPKKVAPAEPKLAIPKGHGDKFKIGLADMRKFKKENRAFAASAPTETTVDLNAPEEGEKIPLVNYPGEVGPTGDRWFTIHKLVEAGKSRAEIVKHLGDKFALSPRNAASTLARFDKAKETYKGLPPKKRIKFARKLLKLARVKGVNQADITGKNVDSQIGGSRFAFHLRQIAHEFKDVDPTLSKMAMHALTLNGRYATGKEGDVYARIGKRMAYHAAGAADHVHKPMAAAMRKFSPEAGSDYDLARTATPAQKKVALAEGIKAQAKVEGGKGIAEAAAGRPAAEWDDFRTRAAARHFSTAYNWDRVNDGLLLDKHVADFLAKRLTGHTDENDLHEKASRSFDLHRGAAMKKAPDWHAKFWAQLTKHVGEKLGKRLGADRINESLSRLSDRAVERREVGQDPDWKKQFHWVGGSKHMKFYRGYWLCH